MNRIESTLPEFIQALEQDKAVVCKNGMWYVEGRTMHIIRILLRTDHRRLESVARTFNSWLDKLEKTPVKFDEENPVNFQNYIRAGEVLAKRVKSPLLSRRVVALKYRIENVHGGLDRLRVADNSFMKQVEKVAEQWMEKQKLYPSTELTKFERKLSKTCEYPEFAKLLVDDTTLQDAFFKWALRDNNKIRPFVEFPITAERVKNAYLASRIGRWSGKALKITKDHVKDFQLPFEILTEGTLQTKNISILDEKKRLTFKGGYRITIKKVLDYFKNKNAEVGRFEYFKERGITNWNTLELGWWNSKKKTYERIDLERPQWWKKMPTLEILTKDEVKKRYDIDEIEEGKWVTLVQATRQSLKMDVEDSHGFIGVLMPNDDKTYTLYEFGKFAKKFPTTQWEKIKFVADTVESGIEYPDEDGFYTHRQKAAAPYVITPEKGEELMDLIRKDLSKAREGNLVFQLSYENCAYWPQTLLEKLLGEDMPNLFKLYVLYTEPKYLGVIFKLIGKLPKKIQPFFLRFLEYLMEWFRGRWVVEDGKRVFKSTTNSDFHKDYHAYIPGYLHEQIEKGKIKGVISFGHGK